VTNIFSVVPALSAALGAVTELVQLVAGLALLTLGLQTARQLLDMLARLAATLTWIAEFTLLAIALVLSVLGDVLPRVGRHLGRAAGRTVAAGADAGRAYRRHLQPTVSALVQHLDRSGRQFVVQQLGTAYPALTAAIAPSVAPSSPDKAPEPAALTVPTPISPATATAPLTRRQLLAMAKDAKIARYSRMTTAQLREAIAA